MDAPLLTDFAPAVVVAAHMQHGWTDIQFAKSVCRDYRVVNEIKAMKEHYDRVLKFLAEDADEENHDGTLIASQH